MQVIRHFQRSASRLTMLILMVYHVDLRVRECFGPVPKKGKWEEVVSPLFWRIRGGE